MTFRGQKSRSYFLTWNMSKTARVTMLDPAEIIYSAHGFQFGWPWEVKGQGHNHLVRYILETVTDTTLDPREDFFESSHRLSIGSQIWPRMTLRGQKPKSVFDVKCVENGMSYNVGPNWGYVECPLASLWMCSLFVYLYVIQQVNVRRWYMQLLLHEAHEPL